MGGDFVVGVVVVVLGAVLVLGIMGSSKQMRSSRRFARRERGRKIKRVWDIYTTPFTAPFITDRYKELRVAPDFKRYSRALYRTRLWRERLLIVRAVGRALVRPLVMLGVVIATGVWFMGLDGLLAFLVEWRKPLLLLVVASFLFWYAVQMERSVEVGDVPFFFFAFVSLGFVVWAVVAAVKIWLA